MTGPGVLALSPAGRARAAVALDPAAAMPLAGYRPDGWQVELIRATREHGQTVVCTSRQAGKTHSLAAAIAAEMVSSPAARVLCVAPSQRQSNNILERVGAFLAPYRMTTARESRSELQLDRGGVAYAVPASSGTIRGYDAITLLVVDEAAWVPNAVMGAVRPMVATAGGRIVAASTPAGRRGWYFDAWDGADAAGWHRIEVPCTRVHRLDAEFLRREARAVPPSVFRSEYLCSFEDSSDALFLPSVLQRAALVDEADVDGLGEDGASFLEVLRSEGVAA